MSARSQFRRPALVRVTHAAGRRCAAGLLPHRARANAELQITPRLLHTPGQSTGWTNLERRTPTTRRHTHTPTRRLRPPRVTHNNTHGQTRTPQPPSTKKTTEASGSPRGSRSSRRTLGLTQIRPARVASSRRERTAEECRPRSEHSGRRSARARSRVADRRRR